MIEIRKKVVTKAVVLAEDTQIEVDLTEYPQTVVKEFCQLREKYRLCERKGLIRIRWKFK